jgi:septal ring factor EnvC (AmiA/AmiB activator)
LLGTILCFLATTLSGQDRNKLEQQRLKIIEKIEETAQLLNDTKTSRKNTISDFNILESQIKFREELINNIDFEINQAEALIEDSQIEMDSLNSEIDNLKGRYEKLLRALYIRKQAQNPLAKLLSIKGINDAFQRWSYTKQYETRNQRQAMKILQAHTKSSTQIDQLQFYKTQREKLKIIENEHRNILREELNAKDGILRDLTDNEKDLRQKLLKHQSNREAFNSAIENLIIAELASGTKTELNLNLPDGNKGSLPWPVEKGVIVQKYGKQKHPTIRNLEISNNGIDIAASKDAIVNCIFEGKVIGISFIPGYDNMVMVQHGNYYTVYSKLKEVFVKKGAAISASEAIGKLGDNIEDGNVQLHFELWKGKSKQNPERWLKKK